MARVIGFGTAALDYRILTGDLGTGYTQKLLAQETSVFGGGVIGNCLVQASRLGAETVWLGKLGRDRQGELIVEQLEAEGIDCSGVLYDSGQSSPFNVAVYAGAGRRRVGGFLLPNSLGSFTDRELTDVAGLVGPGDWVIVEIGEIPLEMVRLFCHGAADRGARLTVDVDLDPILQCAADPLVLEEILSKQDLIMANETSLDSIYPGLRGAELTGALSREYGTSVVVTASDRGCFFAETRRPVVHMPAHPIDVVDSVGAGDAFHGGLLYGLSRSRTLPEAIGIGQACAALNCRAFGAREGMPTIEALEEQSGRR